MLSDAVGTPEAHRTNPKGRHMALSAKAGSLLSKAMVSTTYANEVVAAMDNATTGVAALRTGATRLTTAVARLRTADSRLTTGVSALKRRHAAFLWSGTTMTATTTLLKVKLASLTSRLISGNMMSAS